MTLLKTFQNPIITTLGSYLGPDVQMCSIQNSYNQKIEDQLLENIEWPKDGYQLFEVSSLTGYRLKPGGVGYFQQGIAANANSHGHRDDEVCISKRPDIFRLLVLGDSFTVGANVTQEDAYPQISNRRFTESSLHSSHRGYQFSSWWLATVSIRSIL